MKYWNGSTVFSIAFVLCMFLEHNNIRFFSKQLIKYIHISLSFFRWPGWLALLPHLWWPCHRPALRHHLLRRMQGVLQAEHLQQARLSLQPRQELRDVTQAAQPLPVLPPAQVSADGHEPQRWEGKKWLNRKRQFHTVNLSGVDLWRPLLSGYVCLCRPPVSAVESG